MINKIPESFVTIEEAELLYKAGFDVVCVNTYEKIMVKSRMHKAGEILMYAMFNNNTDNKSLNSRSKNSWHCSCPLRETAVEWIRLNLGYYVTAVPVSDGKFLCTVWKLSGNSHPQAFSINDMRYDSPQDVYKEAIIYLLNSYLNGNFN